MKLHPRVTQPAVDLVKRFEGFRPRAARTPDGRFTIGYGHVLSPRDSADAADISEPEAEFLLKHDLSVTAEAIEESLLAPVNDNQFAALLSFAFNIGVDNFKGSSALRRLNEGAYLQAAAALELWRRADFGGEVMVIDQLVRRRAVEKALFLAPPEGFMPLPSSVLRPAFDHAVVGAAVAWAAARERTAVSRIALEGPETAPALAAPPGLEGEPAPSAAIAAADALAVRLSRILPEDDFYPDSPNSPADFTALRALAATAPTEAAPAAHVEERSGAPAKPEGGAQALQADDVEAESAVEPPPLVGKSVVAPTAWRRRFGRGSFTAAPENPDVAAGAESHDAPFGAAPADFGLASPEAAAEAPAKAARVDLAPIPLFERPRFFQALGVGGVVLFVGSFLCMLHRPSFACLFVGVLGILAMAPAAAFFLFRFLGQPVDPGAEASEEVARAMRSASAGEAGPPLGGEPAAPPQDPFGTPAP